MNKTIFKQLIASAMIFCMLGGYIPITVLADDKTIEISTKQDWLEFAENCRTDSYSAGLSAELVNDIDLTGQSAVSVPIFCGAFNGNGHVISGVKFEAKAEKSGLFRVVSEEASVQNLTVSADITNAGESAFSGIICGENKGLIKDCGTLGSLDSYKDVGGIAGANSGTIQNCSSGAKISGTYQTGGIAGTNDGTIQGCQNSGEINTAANEAATNIGGIAGANENLILDCTNSGKLGYFHTGYNVGGIVGINRGFIRGNENCADISGRRDVGGVAGQMEPSFRLEYGQNAMKLLDDDISGFSSALDSSVSILENAVADGAAELNDTLSQVISFSSEFSGEVSSLFSAMTWTDDARKYLDEIRNEIQYIKDSLPNESDAAALIEQIRQLLEQFDEDNPSAWADRLQQLLELLSGLNEKLKGYAGLKESLKRISDSFGSLSGTVIEGFQRFGEKSTDVMEMAAERLPELSNHITGILEQSGAAVDNARSGIARVADSLNNLQNGVNNVLSGKTNTVEDISAQVTNEDNGMIVSCINEGDISADYNVGGIIGNLSKELSVDQEMDALPTGDDILFADTTLFVRATIYSCQNTGNTFSKYNYSGGILGYGNKGVTADCKNSGNITAGNHYSGGIAGYLNGAVKDSCSIGLLSGKAYVGGIAGKADHIENCTAIPTIESDGAYLGAVAGTTDSASGNFFVNDEYGGINGINYSGEAEAVSYEDLTLRGDMPDIFRTLTVTFQVDGETLQTVSVPFGENIAELPAVESKGGKYWHWKEFEQNKIGYNQTVDGEWKNMITTLSSGEEVPLFLVEGQFDESAHLNVTKNTDADGNGGISYSLSVGHDEADKITVRYLTENEGKIVQADREEKTIIPYIRDGRYIVFELDNGGSFSMEKNNSIDKQWVLAGASSAVIVLLAFVIYKTGICRKKKSGEKQP